MLTQIVDASIATDERNSDMKSSIEITQDGDQIERFGFVIEGLIFADPCLALTRVPAEISKLAVDEIASNPRRIGCVETGGMSANSAATGSIFAI
ncbi:hypothetical protein [Sphingomonas leidyi]|jgi:hypothetical protein|uniref:hypothetical protein n=1 Tax=Sphingomonas leidyi TaxID=68569 RepID=UPI0036D28930